MFSLSQHDVSAETWGPLTTHAFSKGPVVAHASEMLFRPGKRPRQTRAPQDVILGLFSFTARFVYYGAETGRGTNQEIFRYLLGACPLACLRTPIFWSFFFYCLLSICFQHTEPVLDQPREGLLTGQLVAMRFAATFGLANAVLSLTESVLAQSSFTLPNGSQPDLFQTFHVGDSVPITWQQIADPPPSGDLWVTWFDSDDFAQRLDVNIDLSKPGTYTWHINLNSSIISRDPKYIFRLKPHQSDDMYNSTSAEDSSPAVLIIQPDAHAKGEYNKVPITSNTTTPFPASTHPSENDGLRPGAWKFGLAIALLACSAVVVVIMLDRYLRKRRQWQQEHQSVLETQPYRQTSFDSWSLEMRRAKEDQPEVKELPAELPATRFSGNGGI